MKNYERLTARQGKDIYVENLMGTFVIPNCSKTCQKAINRLAELEDKIENGTLIELPCKVGDTIYNIDHNRSACYECEHYSSFYGMDEICDNGCAIYPKFERNKPKCDRHFLEIEEMSFSLSWHDRHINDFNKTWFLTKAEAEKKLKELQNK